MPGPGRERAAYGSWSSPISAEVVTAGAVGVRSVWTSGGDVYWLESRPAEQGRVVLVRGRPGSPPEDVTPPPFSVRSSAHEYGGGAYLVDGTTVIFSNWSDQRLWRQEGGGQPRPLTPGPEPGRSVRYADGRVTAGGSLLVSVRETHRPSGVDNELVSLDARTGAGERVVARGHDFYAAPRPSPDGRSLAWISWDHPRMPWDGTDLWVAELSPEGDVGAPEHVAGGPGESVLEPRWGREGDLWYVSDSSGWWNLYSRSGQGPVLDMEAEFSVPAWTFGAQSHVELADGRIACRWSSGGTDHLGVLEPSSGRLRALEGLVHVSIESLAPLGDRVALVASTPATGPEVLALEPGSGEAEVLRPDDPTGVDPELISLPEQADFPTAGGEFAHGLYYPPRNPRFDGPPGERPPLVVVSHGGPTGAARPGLSLALQFWTSRGFGVVDVNYRGSTGYGRRFRRLLDGQWGVVDVEDCRAAAEHLASSGRADHRRLLVRGASAGGLTTLLALSGPHLFAAGAVYYGVSDLEALARDTHKFESRYLDGLVGPYPEARDVYLERSPVGHVERISSPVILFQGDEDPVVPPAQAEAMVGALRDRGVPFSYVVFEGEQHGFRKASSMQTALGLELSFYGQVLGFEPAGAVPKVRIEGFGQD